MTGYTASADFPLKNPISSGTASDTDGFVTSLSPDSSSLNFSSRLGGTNAYGLSASTYPGGVAVDASGNVYVSGVTESSSIPLTSGALNAGVPGYPAGEFVFLTKLGSSGSLAYGAIIGAIGDASECCSVTGVAVDSTGVAYIAGTTGNVNSAPAWPITPGAYQSNFTGSSQTAPFAAKISADGSALVYSTLIASGLASGMALTSDGSVILTGAYGGSIPVTSNAFSSVVGTSFIAKLSADGTKLPYATYFSTPAGDTGGYITNVAVDGSGNVWWRETRITPAMFPWSIHCSRCLEH